MADKYQAMVHECSFAVHPLNKRVEYCQFCGVLREARGAMVPVEPGGVHRDMTPETLRSMRVALGWTQLRLATATGVSLRTVVRWESGESPIPMMLESFLVAAGSKEETK